jgi:hypothetical protein
MTTQRGSSLFTIAMDLVFVLAAIVVGRVVVEFFGAFAAQQWGRDVLTATRQLVLDFGVKAVPTPYAGRFDIDGALTVVILLAIEWAFSLARRS